MARLAQAGKAVAKDGLKYAVIVALGLCVDLGVALTLRWLFSVPLPLAAAIGFAIGVTFNYLLFELWLFGGCQPSLKRLGKAYIAALGAFGTRIATTWLLGQVILEGSYADFLILVGAIGVSFVVNFLSVKLLLSRTGSAKAG